MSNYENEFFAMGPLKEENKIVHSLWVGDRLSLLECLTIKLLQHHGHEVYLWSYGDIQNVPEGTVMKNAEEILPKESIFKYNGIPLGCIPNGGIGSLSHWSDQFQMRLLELHGGIYIQLDVACLRPLNFKKEFAFVPHMPRPDGSRAGVAAFLMKCPKGSKFTSETYKELSSKINEETIKSMDWDNSMRMMNSNMSNHMPDSNQYFIQRENFMDIGGISSHGPFFEPTPIHPNCMVIHWSNATHKDRKDNPIEGSVYHKLLKYVGLV